MNRLLYRVVSLAGLAFFCGSVLPAAATDMTPIYQLLLFGDGQGVAPSLTYDLNLAQQGNGTGTVTAGPDGTSCGATCITYAQGTEVTLTATAGTDDGSVFQRWSGGGCSGTGNCVLTMDQDLSVTATFTIAVYETESNNGTAAAEAIELDTTRSGQLGTSADSDWYKLETTQAETVTLRFEIPGSNDVPNSSWYIQIHQDNGDGTTTLLTSAKYTGGEDVNVLLPGAGTFYFVIVPGATHSESYYNLTLLSNSGDFDPAEDEVNDNSSAANTLPFDKNMNGSLMRLDDEDWYLVETDTDRDVTIAFTGDHLLDPKGDWEVSVYDGGDTSDYRIARAEVKTGSEFQVKMTAAGGPYYVVVTDVTRSADPTQETYNSTPYKIMVRSNDGIAMPVSDQEPNENAATATEIGPLNTSFAGQLMSKTDQDWYHFSGTAGTTISVTFSTLETDGNALWHFALMASDGTQVQDAWAWGDKNGGNFTATLSETGDYYIRVQIPADYTQWYSSSGYTITVDVQ